MDYILHLVVLGALYTMLALALDLLVGHTGLLSLSHAAFFGVGAYSSALLTVERGASFATGVLVGMAVAALLSLAVSLASLRLRDDYFVIATFGFQMIFSNLLLGWVGFTRGPLGIPAIPSPVLAGWTVDTPADFVGLTSGFLLLTYFVAGRLSSGPFGRVLHAIREDEEFAVSLGKNTLRVKIIVFAVSAALAASAGSLYAHYITYIDPSSFTVMDSLLIIAMIILGGAGSKGGPFIGAFTLILLPEVLRFVGLPTAAAANLRQIFYGVLIMFLMMFRPQGLMGKYRFKKR